MDTVVMVVEGVMRSPGSLGNIGQGVTLYRSLSAASRLWLLSSVWDATETERWLFELGLRGHIGFQDAATFSPADRIAALASIASWSPALVIESDPACAAEEVRLGYPVCLFARPVYAEHRWRPDAPKTPKPWDQVVAELDRQAEMRYADARLKEAK